MAVVSHLRVRFSTSVLRAFLVLDDHADLIICYLIGVKRIDACLVFRMTSDSSLVALE